MRAFCRAYAAFPTVYAINQALASPRASFYPPLFYVRCGESALTRDGDTKVACVLHAHLLLLFKNIGKEDVNRTVASVALSAQVSQSVTTTAIRENPVMYTGTRYRLWKIDMVVVRSWIKASGCSQTAVYIPNLQWSNRLFPQDPIKVDQYGVVRASPSVSKFAASRGESCRLDEKYRRNPTRSN